LWYNNCKMCVEILKQCFLCVQKYWNGLFSVWRNMRGCWIEHLRILFLRLLILMCSLCAEICGAVETVTSSYPAYLKRTHSLYVPICVFSIYLTQSHRRTPPIKRKHILTWESKFYLKRTHSIETRSTFRNTLATH
jgi:hypothetical protein